MPVLFALAIPCTLALILCSPLAVVAAGPARAGETAARAGETAIPAGTIDKDTTWDGTVRVGGVLTVGRDAVLTVKPGTVVLFGKDAALVVVGKLVATGSAEARIRFASGGASPAPGAWEGIRFAGSREGSGLVRCSISDAAAVRVEGCSPAIRECEIANGRVGLFIEAHSAPEVSGNVITRMTEVGILAGRESKPLVARNTVASCAQFGIRSLQGAAPTVRENEVSECGTGIGLTGACPPVERNVLRKNDLGLGVEMAGNRQVIRGNRFFGNATGLKVVKFSDPVIEGNEFSGNGDALACLHSSSPVIRNNVIAGNGQGIVCSNLCKPTIAANDIRGNRKGIFLTLSSYAEIRGNNIHENDIQLELGVMSSDWEQRVAGKPSRGRKAQLEELVRRGRATPDALAQGRDEAGFPGVVDATGNWWGEKGTAEMEKKGPDANIEGLVDHYDRPTHPSEGYPGEYAKDRISYDGWKKARIADAGLR